MGVHPQVRIVVRLAGSGIFCVAMYGGLAFLLEDAKGRAILPLVRRGSSSEAIDEGLDKQLEGIADEPGVRKRR